MIFQENFPVQSYYIAVKVLAVENEASLRCHDHQFCNNRFGKAMSIRLRASDPAFAPL